MAGARRVISGTQPRLRCAGALLLAAVGFFATTALAVAKPNVLVVMTDDQPYGTVSKMPWLSAHADEFTSFREAHTNNALCCPARATAFTGLYDQNTGIDTLNASSFDPRYTLATEFDAAGYRTGLFGKYLNGYPFGRGSNYIPPGWDRFAAFVNRTAANGRAAPRALARELEAEGGAYYDYELAITGRSRRYGSKPGDYSTDVLADLAARFIRNADEEPFLAFYTPYGPHANYTPAPRHKGLYADTRPRLPAGFNRRSTDSPGWWQRRNGYSTDLIRSVIRAQWQTLRSEDQAFHVGPPYTRKPLVLDIRVYAANGCRSNAGGSHCSVHTFLESHWLTRSQTGFGVSMSVVRGPTIRFPPGVQRRG